MNTTQRTHLAVAEMAQEGVRPKTVAASQCGFAEELVMVCCVLLPVRLVWLAAVKPVLVRPPTHRAELIHNYPLTILCAAGRTGLPRPACQSVAGLLNPPKLGATAVGRLGQWAEGGETGQWGEVVLAGITSHHEGLLPSTSSAGVRERQRGWTPTTIQSQDGSGGDGGATPLHGIPAALCCHRATPLLAPQALLICMTHPRSHSCGSQDEAQLRAKWCLKLCTSCCMVLCSSWPPCAAHCLTLKEGEGVCRTCGARPDMTDSSSSSSSSQLALPFASQQFQRHI
ncbi:hypothetical protein O3P69_010789 [Scylla paramamosain]|uniref:Uncharacterized protein n=1 Tax=Scylla paramamosain TaxID=85552 RepID=A0AAW0TF85_SCYPA